jgi:phosphatidylglycerol---prolipoprotein diacylglyceryl transferase
MRQVLFRIWFEQPWAWWTAGVEEVPLLGAGWVWLILGGIFFLFHAIRRDWNVLADRMTWVTWALGLLLLSLAPLTGILPASLPVFGYGAMVLLGFGCAYWFARARAARVGIDPELVTDASFWLLISGIIGGRAAYLVQYRDLVFREVRGLDQALLAVVNLSEGGLVVIGALVGATLGLLAFSYRRGVSFWEFADLVMPAAFIAMAFGRIGCLLNGCCFGDACSLPWAITFPQGSTTFEALAMRGFIDPAAEATIPLHPTQVYSAINNLVLAIVTGTYYWYRRAPGDVFALSCILYPITRILLEFLRADEMGQLGTGLTISQIYSLLLLAAGIVLLNRHRFLRQQPALAGPAERTAVKQQT